MFLVILKWVLLGLAIIMFFGAISYFSDHKEGAGIRCIVMGVLFLIGFFVMKSVTNAYDFKNKQANFKAIKKKVKEMQSNLTLNVDLESEMRIRQIRDEKNETKRKSKGTEFYKNSIDDKKMLETIGAVPIPIEQYLVRTQEPKNFVVAPMTYKIEDHLEREDFILMEEVVLKFEAYIDNMPGFSFIDRSKIEQIEREHKFQLSDWSNDKKTAEIGRALNANVLLFLDKFYYLKRDGGEYRFEAKFVDINTMQTNSYLLVYRGKKLTEPTETLQKIDFANFTKISQITENPFEEEKDFSVKGCFRISQNMFVRYGNNQNACPLGFVEKLDFSEFDVNTPQKDILDCTSLTMDGFDSIELKFERNVEKGKYSFEPCEQYIVRLNNNFYTDGKIGSLSIQTDNFYEKFDVFTENGREYFLKIDSADFSYVTVNYYMQIIKN